MAEAEVDLSDPEGVRQQKKSARQAEIARLDLLLAIMSRREGRDWIFDLLTRCHIFHSSFSSDPLVMAFREGERNIGLSLEADILSKCPEHFITMLTERNDGK